MAEVNRRWIYPTVTASENKGIERIALSGEGLAHEVVGIDGSRKFGCRPASGFQHVHTLDMLKDFSGETDPPPVASKTSTVTDCFPVHFQIKENEFGHGFVYRVKTSTSAAVYMDFRPTLGVDSNDDGTAESGWRTILISDHATNDVDPDADMDVVSMGRYVFTFVKGRASRVFYTEYDDGASIYVSKVVDGGPGENPVLLISGESNPFNGTSEPPRPNTDPSFTATTPSWARIGTTATDPDTDSDNPDRDYHLFKPGNYSFSYYLHNSLTGRRTGLSTIAAFSEDDNPIDTAGRYIGITFDVDTSKFDEIYLFRSVNLQSVGGTYAGSIMHLDNIYTLSDLKDSTPSDAPYTGTDWQVKTAYYELDDIGLAMQDIYLDKVVYDSEVPYVGNAVAFEGSLIVSDPDGPTGEITYGPFTSAVSLSERIRNVGEIRWSSLTERSPELFPINNKYSPDVYQNRVTRLVRTGDFAIGFSKDRLYHIRRNGIYLRIEDLHAGYGLVGRNAVAEAGPLVYFVTRKGLKAVANNGQLDSVQALDNLLLEDWYSDLEDLRLSFDPYMSCLFILNPNKDQTVCLWFGTGRVSEFHDVPFSDVRCGIWEQGYDNNASPAPTFSSSTTMVERAFFLQNAPTTTAANIPDGWEPRVYIQDFDRVKESNDADDIADGTPSIRTLEFDGDVIFKVGDLTTGSGITTADILSDGSASKTLSSGSDGYDLVGAYAYIVGSTDPTKIGTKRQIFKASPGTAPVTQGVGAPTLVFNRWDALSTGDIIAISPVLFRYVGGALPMIRSQDGQVVSSMDLFQNKQVSSVGCHFSDVSGGVTGYRFFKGLVFNTESDSAAVSAFPVDFAGTLIGDSIQTGESDDYAAFTTTGLTTTGRHGIQDSALNPGIEIFCPDVDFKLMAVICRGRTTNTDTSERSSP